MTLIRYRPLLDLSTEFRTLHDELNRFLQAPDSLPQVAIESKRNFKA